jgi:hypothetical protein
MKTREEYLIESFNLLRQTTFAHVIDWPELKFSISDLSKNTLGVCYSRAASAAGLNEIFISASCADSEKIIKILVHELCHAILDCQGAHGSQFKTVAKQAGLMAPFATAKNGEVACTTELDQTVSAIVEALGPIPHSELKKPAPKPGRNNHKLVCGGCGWQANTSKKHIVTNEGYKIRDAKCPACGSYQVDAI